MTHPTLDNPRTHEQRLRMSYAEFLAWGDDTTHAEWVDGEVIVFMPPKTAHQFAIKFLLRLLDTYVETLQLGTVVQSPFEMRLIPGRLSREPDILFVARQNQARLTPQRLEGLADLAVEIISEESATRDRVRKFAEYQQAGVREYWLIDPRPDQQQTMLYHLTSEGTYAAIQPDEQGRCHSTVLPGFWLRPAWLWQEPLPDPLLTLLSSRMLPLETLQSLRDAMGGEA